MTTRPVKATKATKTAESTGRVTPKTTHTLLVTLRVVEPAVWRRIVVRSEWKLDRVNTVLESVMGWYGDHLHAYEAGGVAYVSEQASFGGFPSSRDERREGAAKLSDVLSSVGSTLRWDYDFGDGWEHDVVCEAITARDANAASAAVVAGENACPPEDCGGPWGYADLLAAPLRSQNTRNIRISRNGSAARSTPPISTLPAATLPSVGRGGRRDAGPATLVRRVEPRMQSLVSGDAG